jgi:hypothetical protein
MPIQRTPMQDDDGSGSTGTIVNNLWKQELYDQIDAAVVWTVVTTTATGSVYDWDPGIVGHTLIRCNNAAVLSVAGLRPALPPYAGQRIRLVRLNAQVDTYANHAATTVGYRLAAPAGVRSLAVMWAYIEFMYDPPSGFWVECSFERGT